MTLDERIRYIVVDTMRTWPVTPIESVVLLRLLDTMGMHIKAACLEEKREAES